LKESTGTTFYTLGEARLEAAGTVLSTRRKELALLAYLVGRGPRGASREELSSILWEDSDRAHARQSLRQALVDLKRQVGEGLVIQGERVSLDPSRVWVDSVAIDEDLRAGRLSVALGRWDGELLAGMDDIGGETFRGWLEGARASLRARIRAAFARMTADSAATGAWTAAADWSERWAAAFPLDEDAHVQLAEALNLSGRQAAAVSRLAEYRARIQVELGAEPSPALLALQSSLERTLPSARRAASPGSAALFTPDIVGRDHALAELAAAWSEVRNGASVCVAVEAESGMGRTRLLEEFMRRVRQASSAVVLHAKGRRTGEAEAWSVLKDLFSGVEATPGLMGASPAAIAALAIRVPALQTRFPALSDAAVEADTGNAFGEILSAITEECPVLLVLDDLTRVDESTMDSVIRGSARQTSRLLFVATVATDDPTTPDALERLRSLGHLRRLKLPPLGHSDLEALLESMLQLSPADRRQLAARLETECGGSPFYAVEMTAALVDEGLLVTTDEGGWRLAAGGDWSFPHPASIREAMTRRILRLSPAAREIAEASSLSSGPSDREALRRRCGLPDEAFQAGLEELVRARIMRPAPGGNSYDFTQDATGGIIAAAMSPARRHALEQGTSAWAARHRGAITAGVVLLGLAAFAVVRTHEGPALDRQLALAAPLRNETGDPALDPIGDLAADWITQGIAESGVLHVVSPLTLRASVRTVKSEAATDDRESRLVALAKETGAGIIVGGSYYRTGDSLTFQLRITDGANGRVLSAPDPIRGGARDPSGALALLRERTVAALALLSSTRLSGMSQNASRPPAFQAYKEFVQGLDLHVQYRYQDALDHYRRAEALDSSFGSPVVWSALAYWSLGDYPRTDSMLTLAQRMGDRLSTFDALLAANQRGELHGDYTTALAAAEEMTRVSAGSEGFVLVGQESIRLNRQHRAVEAFLHADPDRGWIRGWEGYWGYLSWAYHLTGDFDRSLAAAKEGRRRYPSSPYCIEYEVIALAALHRMNELNAALGEAESRALLPESPPALMIKSAALELLVHGHADDARRMAARGLQSFRAHSLPPSRFSNDLGLDLATLAGDWKMAERMAAALPEDSTTSERDGYLGYLAAVRGDTAETQRRIARLAAFRGAYDFGDALLWQARIAAHLGQQEAAVHFLREALGQGASRGYLGHDANLLSLRGYQPFDELVRSAD
jgi:DNA-binding SARP family transcriptional activator/tetratricopeptide (TPR) repeat protein